MSLELPLIIQTNCPSLERRRVSTGLRVKEDNDAAFSKYIVVDMYAKAVQGMKAEDAVKWAEGELKKVYES